MRLRPPSPNRSEDLAPVRVNMRLVSLVGTALWLAGGAVVVVLLAVGTPMEPDLLWICAAGAALGVGGWVWSRWRRW